MPQLMPLYWVFSFLVVFIIFIMFYMMYYCYNIIMIFYEMKKYNSMKIDWMW